MPKLTFWGHFSGTGSYVVVSHAIANYLYGLLGDALVVGDLRLEGLYGDLPDDMECVPEDEWQDVQRRYKLRTAYRGDVQEGVGLVFGFPEWNAIVPRYEVNVGYHVCDVSAVPAQWVTDMNRMDYVLTPSGWCAEVFGACGVRVPITVVPHGVSIDVSVDMEPEGFTLLHYCSAEDPTRKGTLKLIDAFERVEKRIPGVELLIHSSSALVVDRVLHNASGRVLCVPQAYVNPEEQARRLKATRALVAPSRAEGFGIIPLEALCLGTPIVATQCTGHATWARSVGGGAEWIRSGPLDPCGAGPGLAPRVTVGAIAEALLSSYMNYDTLRSEALARRLALREVWAWSKVLKTLGSFLSSIGLSGSCL